MPLKLIIIFRAVRGLWLKAPNMEYVVLCGSKALGCYGTYVPH